VSVRSQFETAWSALVHGTKATVNAAASMLGVALFCCSLLSLCEFANSPRSQRPAAPNHPATVPARPIYPARTHAEPVTEPEPADEPFERSDYRHESDWPDDELLDDVAPLDLDSEMEVYDDDDEWMLDDWQTDDY